MSNRRLHIGTAGWTIPRLASARFPAAGSHLHRYSQILNCAEINSCFYRPHKRGTWEKWRASVAPGFQFSVKAPKAVTHEAKLKCSRLHLAAFFDQILILEEKLGPVLFQLPPSFAFDEALVREFLCMLRELYSGAVVWEPRHPTWFAPSADCLLETFKIARVAADPGCIPAASHPGGWNGLVYYRLHGSPRRYYSAYPADFLKRIAYEIGQTHARDAWCVFDNTASGAAIENALEMAGFGISRISNAKTKLAASVLPNG